MIKSRAFKLLIVIFVFSTIAFRIWQTTGCRQLTSFYFNPLQIRLSVERDVNTDVGVNRGVSRFFHNKLTEGTFEFFKAYAAAFDPRFLIEMLGPLQVALAALTFKNIFKKGNEILLVHSWLILSFSAFAVLTADSKITYPLLAVSWNSFSIWGIKFIPKGKIWMTIFIVLGLASFCYFIFGWRMTSICKDIYFK